MLRRLLVILFAITGLAAAVYLNTDPIKITRLQQFLLVASLFIAVFPPFASRLSISLDKLRHPTPRRRAMITLIIAAVSTLYLIATAYRQHRDLYPRFHDDQVYLLQMRFLSTGRLWTASPALPDFFDTFYVLVTPVYAPIYFPGAAMLYVWEIWLHTPIWFGPAIAAGVAVALMFRITTELLDDAVLGFLAALFLLGVTWFRYLSMVVMSHTALMLLGLGLIFAFLKWRQKPSLARAAIFGALAGWAAITRPTDAIAYAAPVSLALLWELRTFARPQIVRTLAIILLAAAPFLSIQLIFDKGVTGRFLKTPWSLYNEIYDPNLSYGASTYDPTLLPHTVVLQKKIFDQYFIAPLITAAATNGPVRSWIDWKFHKLLTYALPRGPLIALIVLGLPAITRKRTFILSAIFPIFLLTYSFFAFLLPQYCVLPAPALAVLVVLGIVVLRENFPRGARPLELFATLAVVVLTLFSLPEFTGEKDDIFQTPTMRQVALDLPRTVQPPAVVLFRFNPHDDYVQEPVYNLDTVHIDDAPIIRAHDLGPQRDQEIFNYYAGRNFYLFDRRTSEIHRLGNAINPSRESTMPATR